MDEKLGNSSRGLKNNDTELTASINTCPTGCKSEGSNRCSKHGEKSVLGDISKIDSI